MSIHNNNFIRFIQDDIPLSAENFDLWWNGYQLSQYKDGGWYTPNDMYENQINDPYDRAYITGGGSDNYYNFRDYSSIDTYLFSVETDYLEEVVMPSVGEFGGSTSSSTAGYTAGGQSQTGATVDFSMKKLDFSTTTPSTSTVESDTNTNMLLSAFTDSNNGYFPGGTYNSATTKDMKIFVYSTDTSSTTTNALNVGRSEFNSLNSSLAGYVFNGADTTSIEKFGFSAGSFSLLTNDLPKHIKRASSINSTTNGYLVGGFRYDAIYDTYDEITKFNKSTEELLLAISKLSSGPRIDAAGYMSSSAGYVAGGEYYKYINYDNVEKIVFASDHSNSIPMNRLAVRNPYGHRFVRGASVFSTGLVNGIVF